MLWAILFCVAMILGTSDNLPIGAWPDTALAYDLSSDYMDGFYGPFVPDLMRSRFPGPFSSRLTWPFDRYGAYWAGDAFDPGYPLGPLDYPYHSGYPKTAEVAKENYVRDNPFGGTEVGIRDSVSMRSGPWRTGLSRFGPLAVPPYFPRSGWRGYDRLFNPLLPDSDFAFSPYRRPFLSAAARPSSLRFGGDYTYVRR